MFDQVPKEFRLLHQIVSNNSFYHALTLVGRVFCSKLKIKDYFYNKLTIQNIIWTIKFSENFHHDYLNIMVKNQ